MYYPFKICDPIHGFIRFNAREQRVIDSRPFQRLRYIRQMGVAYLVYPGANHTRFEHSLGVMELVSRIYQVINHDLPQKEFSYWQQILRLAALCHDMGHLPFSHTAEKVLLPDGGHEQMTIQIIRSEELRSIWKELGEGAEEAVLKLAVNHPNDTLSPTEKLLSQIITEDNFGADRIDYLLRDAYYTGVGYGFDSHQLIDTLRILPNGDTLVLGVTASGIQSVESLLIARYMMYSRVYQHPKSRVYANHMLRFMQTYYDMQLPYLEQTDYTIMTLLMEMAKQGDYDAQVLLKQKPAYEAIHCDDLEKLMSLGKDVFIDTAPLQKTERDFPVLNPDGHVVSSEEASPFLRNIPLGGKPLQVYVHPQAKSQFNPSSAKMG